MLGAEANITPILMAKMPRKGRVKTRLTAGGGLTPDSGCHDVRHYFRTIQQTEVVDHNGPGSPACADLTSKCWLK